MSDSEYHMVEFRPVAGGEPQLVRGARKTDEEIAAEREHPVDEYALGVIVKSSGPTGGGATVCDAQSGHELKGVSHLSIDIAPDAITTVYAQICAASIEVAGRAVFYVTDPATGESKPAKRIEFDDGSEWKS